MVGLGVQDRRAEMVTGDMVQIRDLHDVPTPTLPSHSSPTPINLFATSLLLVH
ncbi:unnamed protein product [Periconia digitata]|uniref:Uncharacterized protein n=1 Tax=Periconia digitata TaxID=1303443 RepID=A0A9W4XRT9_9PLEO|nr:unnamed protein product [Periconia digitata]